jgi:hypothetical protein
VELDRFLHVQYNSVDKYGGMYIVLSNFLVAQRHIQRRWVDIGRLSSEVEDMKEISMSVPASYNEMYQYYVISQCTLGAARISVLTLSARS